MKIIFMGVKGVNFEFTFNYFVKSLPIEIRLYNFQKYIVWNIRTVSALRRNEANKTKVLHSELLTVLSFNPIKLEMLSLHEKGVL